MSSGEDSNRDEELAVVNLEHVKRISETYKPKKGKGKHKKGTISKAVVQEIWKDRLSPRFYSRLMSVMFPEESNEVSFLSFYTIYKNLAEPESEIMFRALTIYHIATIHEPPFNYEQANEYPNATYKAIKDYVCDVITSYFHSIIHFNMKEAHAWLDLRASNTLIDGNLVASYMLKDLETHRNEVSIGSLEIWLEKNEMYYTVSEQLFLFLFGVNNYVNVKPLIPHPVCQPGKSIKTLLALPDVLLLNSKLPKRAQRWTLAYILDSRSHNWDTFKQAIYGKSQTIIVIQDANGDIFGMYGSQRWFPSEGFFGNSECFLFTLKPDVNIYEGSGRDNNFQLFTESGIGMGGTQENPGLFIQNDMVKGTTSLVCSTFREFWPLARVLEYKITQIEIWTVPTTDEMPTGQDIDVAKLIDNTQYMRNEVYRVEQPSNKPGQSIRSSVDNTATNLTEMSTKKMYKSVRCCGECARNTKISYEPNVVPQNKFYNQGGGVCCSKRCPTKIQVSTYCQPPRASSPCRGDGDRVICASKFPRQEEERRQYRRIYSEDKVKITAASKRCRISFDARQKHSAAAGFIHPSLAAEENERNKKESTPSLPTSNPKNKANKAPNKPKKSSNYERTSKSNSPNFIDNQVQVGESRLMKPTCRLYKTKCGCNVKNSFPTCACSPMSKSLQLETGEKNVKKLEMTTANELPNDPKKSDLHQTYPLRNVSYSTSRLIKVITSDSDSTIGKRDREPSPEVEKSKPQPKTESTKKSNVEDKDNQKPQPLLSQSTTKASSKRSKKESMRSKEPVSTTNFKALAYQMKTNFDAPANILSKSWAESEIDCRCSSSTIRSESSETKKVPPTSLCHCEENLSNYLTKTNRTNAKDIQLEELSSSVCSCILDKNKATVISGGISTSSTKKEVQSVTKSMKLTTDSTDNTLLTSKKETQYLTKSRKLSARSKSSSKQENHNSTKPRCNAETPSFFMSTKQETLCSTCLRKMSTGSPSFTIIPERATQNITNSIKRVSTESTSSDNPRQEKNKKILNSAKSRKICQGSPSFSLPLKKETHYLAKNLWKERSSIENEIPSVPPTCLKCRTLVESGKCRCRDEPTKCSSTNRVQNVHLQKSSSTKVTGSSDGGSRQLISMDLEIVSTSTADSSKLVTQENAEATSGSNVGISSHSSQVKGATRRTCKSSCKCSLARSYFPVFPEDFIKDERSPEDCDCASYNDLRFPVFVETPPASPDPSIKSEPEEPEIAQEEAAEEVKETKCGCDDNDNTIIILNVTKCNTMETVEKIIQEIGTKNGNASDSNIKSLVFKCKDFPGTNAGSTLCNPCTSKGGPEREALRQHIEKILQKKGSPNQPEHEQGQI